MARHAGAGWIWKNAGLWFFGASTTALTAAGMALLARAVPVWEQAHGATGVLLDAGGADALRAGLARLSRQMG